MFDGWLYTCSLWLLCGVLVSAAAVGLFRVGVLAWAWLGTLTREEFFGGLLVGGFMLAIFGAAFVVVVHFVLAYFLGLTLFLFFIVLPMIGFWATEMQKQQKGQAISPSYKQFEPSQVYGDAELATPVDIVSALRGKAGASPMMFED